MNIHNIAVVGAVNLDICGTSNEQLILYDSNPGKSVFSFGGVGRNIAENLCRLGQKVDMITALGDDAYSKDLIAYSENTGIDFSHSLIVPGEHCSTYISINNISGDMILGVSDMDIYKHITVDYIASQIDFLNEHELVIVDTNLTEEVLEYIAKNCTTILAVDPVSTKKAEKLRNIIGCFDIIKPNIYEVEVLTDIKIELDNNDTLNKAADQLFSLGVEKVFISLAEDGVFYADSNKRGISPICSNIEVKNVAGCGDSFLAATCISLLDGDDISTAAKVGECASAICAGSEKTISPDMSQEKINEFLLNGGF